MSLTNILLTIIVIILAGAGIAYFVKKNKNAEIEEEIEKDEKTYTLEAMRDYNVKYIVFSSTAATYGEPEVVPITEKNKFECDIYLPTGKWQDSNGNIFNGGRFIRIETPLDYLPIFFKKTNN